MLTTLFWHATCTTELASLFKKALRLMPSIDSRHTHIAYDKFLSSQTGVLAWAEI